MDAVIRQHPDKDIRIIFYAENKANINWCIKRKIKYAIGSIPQEWLNE